MDDSHARKFDEIKKTQIKKLQQKTKKTVEQLSYPGETIPHLSQFIKNISSKQLTTMKKKHTGFWKQQTTKTSLEKIAISLESKKTSKLLCK